MANLECQAAAVVAIVVFAAAATTDAQREVCMLATSLRWTQLRFAHRETKKMPLGNPRDFVSRLYPLQVCVDRVPTYLDT